MINKILSTALKLWLRSQVEEAEDLQVEIIGGDRQIFKGYLPGVFLTSSHAIYQGLHLRQLQLSAKNIQINLGQVLKGKPLKLLEPVTATGEISLSATDLELSLSSSLLSSALEDLLVEVLKVQDIDNPREILATYQMNWDKISLGENQLTLKGNLTNSEGKTTPVSICTGLHLANSHTLMLSLLQIDTVAQLPFSQCQKLTLDLGTEVAIAKLKIASETLFCSVGLTVFP
jgi:hypothetical protein